MQHLHYWNNYFKLSGKFAAALSQPMLKDMINLFDKGN